MDKPPVDFFLRHRRFTCAFADVYKAGVPTANGEYIGLNKSVVEDHVRLPKRLAHSVGE